VLVLAALLSAVLLGFLGLVVDAGQLAAGQQADQSAADGAALAAAYSIGAGATVPAATTAAGNVLTAVGLPTSALSLSFLDAGGAVTANAASVASVAASVSQSRPTFFLGALGIRTFTAGAASAASVARCALCVMGASGTTVTEGTSAQVQVSGAPAVVNSNGSPNLSLAASAKLQAPAVTIAGGTPSLGSGASITPSPVVGAVIGDPLAGLAAPSVAGSATTYFSPFSGGSGSIGPGVYAGIYVFTGYTLTLNPGTYVMTGPLYNLGGTIQGTGVLVYLACTSYPAGCSGAGGHVNASAGTTTLTAASSGAYSGVAVFADRGDTATNTVASGQLTVNGALYAVGMPLTLTQTGDSATVNGELIVSSLSLAASAQLTVAPAGALPAAVRLSL